MSPIVGVGVYALKVDWCPRDLNALYTKKFINVIQYCLKKMLKKPRLRIQQQRMMGLG